MITGGDWRDSKPNRKPSSRKPKAETFKDTTLRITKLGCTGMNQFNQEEFIDIDPDEIVEYIFEELVDMGLATERQYIHVVLNILIEYFMEMGLLQDDE